MGTPVNPKTGFVTKPTSDFHAPAKSPPPKISSQTGFVTAPSSGEQNPVRPSQPVGGGVIATADAGKVSKKVVKG